MGKLTFFQLDELFSCGATVCMTKGKTYGSSQECAEKKRWRGNNGQADG